MSQGDRIREAREAKGLSQAALAERVGVFVNTVSRWEANTRSPRDAMLARLASELDTTERHLKFGREDNPNDLRESLERVAQSVRELRRDIHHKPDASPLSNAERPTRLKLDPAFSERAIEAFSRAHTIRELPLDPAAAAAAMSSPEIPVTRNGLQAILDGDRSDIDTIIVLAEWSGFDAGWLLVGPAHTKAPRLWPVHRKAKGTSKRAANPSLRLHRAESQNLPTRRKKGSA